jgi:hypothetical protein
MGKLIKFISDRLWMLGSSSSRVLNLVWVFPSMANGGRQKTKKRRACKGTKEVFS